MMTEGIKKWILVELTLKSSVTDWILVSEEKEQSGLKFETWVKIINKNRGWRSWYICTRGAMDSTFLNALYQKAPYPFVYAYSRPLPPIHGFTLSDFSCPKSTVAWKQMIHFLMCGPKFISSHHVSILSSHITRQTTVQYFETTFMKLLFSYITIILLLIS